MGFVKLVFLCYSLFHWKGLPRWQGHPIYVKLRPLILYTERSESRLKFARMCVSLDLWVCLICSLLCWSNFGEGVRHVSVNAGHYLSSKQNCAEKNGQIGLKIWDCKITIDNTEEVSK